MAITPLPTAPAVTDTAADFNNKAFAWVDALDTFTTEANALAADINQDAIDVAAAALDAATIETVWSDMQPLFLGGKASDPTLDNEGNALVEGAIYFNTTTDTLRAYTGTDWADAGAAIPITLTHDTFNGDGSTVDFTLSVTPGSQNAVRVSLSGVIQVPGTDYTLTNAILTFTTAPPTGTGNISCLSTTPIQVGTPNDASVSTAKLQDNAVATAKIADDAVTLAKMQNIATARILGRSTAGSGNVEELTIAASLTLSGGALSGTAATATQAGVVELATSAEVQAGTDPDRSPSVSSLRTGLIVNGSPQATTSGSGVTFSIPSWAKEITIMLKDVSLSGTDAVCVQIGDAGGIEVTGYTGLVANAAGSVAGSSYSGAFFLQIPAAQNAASQHNAVATLNLFDGTTWMFKSVSTDTTLASANVGSGYKALSAALTTVKIVASGANTFDAGSVNVSYK